MNENLQQEPVSNGDLLSALLLVRNELSDLKQTLPNLITTQQAMQQQITDIRLQQINYHQQISAQLQQLQQQLATFFLSQIPSASVSPNDSLSFSEAHSPLPSTTATTTTTTTTQDSPQQLMQDFVSDYPIEPLTVRKSVVFYHSPPQPTQQVPQSPTHAQSTSSSIQPFFPASHQQSFSSSSFHSTPNLSLPSIVQNVSLVSPSSTLPPQNNVPNKINYNKRRVYFLDWLENQYALLPHLHSTIPPPRDVLNTKSLVGEIEEYANQLGIEIPGELRGQKRTRNIKSNWTGGSQLTSVSYLQPLEQGIEDLYIEEDDDDNETNGEAPEEPWDGVCV